MKSPIKSIALTGFLALAISALSLQAAEDKKASQANAKPTAEESFAKLDKDESGTLSKNEFLGARLKNADRRFGREGGSAEDVAAKVADFKKRLGKTFARTDADKSGDISLDEYVASRKKGEKRAGKKKAPNS